MSTRIDGLARIVQKQRARRVVWFNASGGDAWCDLPRCKSFVPLVDRLLRYLSASGWRRSFDCGEPVTVQVLFIGTDTLWGWQTLGPRSEAGVTLYSAFWQHALRALAPSEPTSSANQLWLRPERTLYGAGDRVRVTAEWRSEGTDASVSAPGTNPSPSSFPTAIACRWTSSPTSVTCAV